MKIGILYCAFNCKNYLNNSLLSFIESKKENIIFKIAAVSIPFEEYFYLNQKNDGTPDELKKLKNQNLIDEVFTEPHYIKEHEARDLCLQYLKKEGCDYFWIVDGDEFYTQEEISKIINFIKENPDNAWYSINFKNYIFDGKQWIDGFCPPRIFKIKSAIFENVKFYWDNDIVYIDKNQNQVSYKQFKNIKIPKELTHIKHLTWLHENGLLKYEYQMKHFGHCGYKWNYELNELEFNEDFFSKTNQKKPIVLKDESI